MPPRRFIRFAWTVVAYNLAVIVWGAYVRATGSGAGCGSHWPLCNGEVVPRSPSVETLIEYSHRLTSGVALLLVVGLTVWAFRAFEKGHRVRRAAAWAMIFMLGEAAIGAGLVLLELVAGNDSLARAGWMAAHLGNTFLLLAALALVPYWAAGGVPPRAEALPAGGRGRLLRLAAAALALTLLTAASGAVTALGDTLFPATSLVDELRQDLSPSAHLLKQLRVYHPLLAVAAGLVMLSLANVARTIGAARGFANLLSLGVFVQLAVGTLNVLLLAPVWMQLVHLLLADLLWIVLVLTCAAGLGAERLPTTARATRPLPAT